jgi:hypothetical protein
MQVTELIVRRQKALWQDRMRSYRVYVDGVEVAQVANGAEVQTAITPGEHVVQLKIDWCRSKSLNVNVRPGESLTLECGPNSTPLLALVFITLLHGQYLWLRQSETAVPAGS